VIRAEITDAGVALVADLPPGSHAYVDRDWVPASSGDVAALAVTLDGRMAWRDDPPVEGSRDVDPVTKAARVLLAVAQDAAAAVEGVGPVAITGRGLVARRVRALVAGRLGLERGERPRAIVETTGDPRAILDATRCVAELGIVVLAGESHGRGAVELDFYPDVHVRGLTLVGIAPPLQDARNAATEPEPVEASVLAWCLDGLAEVRSGSLVSDDAAWSCVTA
jgi:hypothetical protein